MFPFAIAQIDLSAPAGPAEFLKILEQYNLAVWPAQFVLLLLAVVALGLVVRQKTKYSDRLVAGIIAFLWLWTTVAFWYAQFAPVAGIGNILAAVFAVQAGIFLYVGVWHNALQFGFERDRYSLVGGLFVLYALIGYPILGVLIGHLYPQTPSLGMPCPITVFTFGMLLLTVRRVPKVVLVVPLIFAAGFGVFPPLNYGIYEDIGLVLAGIVGTALLVYRDRTVTTPTSQSPART